jgi:hypothetical protein
MTSLKERSTLAWEDKLEDELLDRAPGGTSACAAVRATTNGIRDDLSASVNALVLPWLKTHAAAPLACAAPYSTLLAMPDPRPVAAMAVENRGVVAPAPATISNAPTGAHMALSPCPVAVGHAVDAVATIRCRRQWFDGRLRPEWREHERNR